MYQSLEIFGTSAAMARHAGARQAVIARNLAHADTPGFVARDIPSFQDSLSGVATSGLRTTRAGHIAGHAGMGPYRSFAAGSQPSPNGNAVSIEQEMLRSVEAQRQHSRALAVYRHGMQVIRTALGR